MTTIEFIIRPELVSDFPAIDDLVSSVFGPGMHVRAASALREGVDHEQSMSFVAQLGDAVVGSVRLTKFFWGDDVALMLGPLAVKRDHSGKGAGKALMNAAIDKAKSDKDNHDCDIVMLVGDLSYYKPFGFKRIPQGKIELPRPADPYRVLACELTENAISKKSGRARRCLIPNAEITDT